MPVAHRTKATERITIPVASGSIALVERFDENDPEPHVWYMVSVPMDAEAVVEDLVDEAEISPDSALQRGLRCPFLTFPAPW
jgi:hypothetical protein